MPLLVEENGAVPKTPVHYLHPGAEARDAEDLRDRRPGRAPGTQPLPAVNEADFRIPGTTAGRAPGPRAAATPRA